MRNARQSARDLFEIALGLVLLGGLEGHSGKGQSGMPSQDVAKSMRALKDTPRVNNVEGVCVGCGIDMRYNISSITAAASGAVIEETV